MLAVNENKSIYWILQEIVMYAHFENWRQKTKNEQQKMAKIIIFYEWGSRKTISLSWDWRKTKVLFKDLNPGIAMAIVRFKFSRKLYFCFESIIRQKFKFSAFSEMAQKILFWLHWMKRNYVFVMVDDKVSKFKSIQNWNWKFLLNFLEIAIKVIHFMFYLI